MCLPLRGVTIISPLHSKRCQATAELNYFLSLRDRSRIRRKKPPMDRFQFSVKNDSLAVGADQR